MESIINNLLGLIRTYAFEGGIIGILVAILLLIGLIYLFLRRNQVMTITYGLTLLSMVIFLVICIFTLLLTCIYGVSYGRSLSSVRNKSDGYFCRNSRNPGLSPEFISGLIPS